MVRHAPSEDAERRPVLANESGIVLLVAMIIAFAISFVGSAFLTLGDYEVDLVAEAHEDARAFWLAEAGRHHAMMILTRDYGYNAPTANIPSFVSASASSGTYAVSLSVGGTDLFLSSVGTTGSGRSKTVITRIAVESFAKYLYFTEAEVAPGGQPIWFFSGDRIEGPLHTNGQIHIAGTPRFDDLATSRSATFLYYNNGNPIESTQGSTATDHPDFRGTPAPGYQLGVEEIPMPMGTGDLRQAATSGGLALTGNHEIVLSPSNRYGRLSYRRTDVPDTWHEVANPPNGVIHVQGTLELEGTLDGRMTIGATGDIVVTDDIVYRASNGPGQPASGCDDYLGVVASRNIIIADNAANGNHVRLNGVYMALETSFRVENYASGSYRGNLTVWGGLIQKYRGPVGTFGGRGGRTGYAKDYHFDTRMQTSVPPMFPISYRRVFWNAA